MATLVNSLNGVDFSSHDEINLSGYPSDPLTFFQQSCGSTMSNNEGNLFHQFLTSEPEQQLSREFMASPQSFYRAQHQPMTPNTTASFYPSNSQPGMIQSASAISSSSDTNTSIRSAASSNIGSPQLGSSFPPQYHRPHQAGHCGFLTGGDDSQLQTGSFESHLAGDYEGLFAGERDPTGFVGESQPISSSSPRGFYGYASHFPSFPLPSQDEPSFKKPYATPKSTGESSHATNSPSDVQLFRNQGEQWRQIHPGRAALVQSTGRPDLDSPGSSQILSPSAHSPHAAHEEHPGWLPPNSLPQQSGYFLPESQSNASPSLQQQQETSEDFMSSPSSVQSHFFHQSSGNFIAPLESSCWFPYSHPFFSSLRC